MATFTGSIQTAQQEIQALRSRTVAQIGVTMKPLFRCPSAVLEDPALIEAARQRAFLAFEC